MTDIKARIEKLFGGAPSGTIINSDHTMNDVLELNSKWWQWRQDLIDRLAKDAHEAYSCRVHVGKACGVWSADNHELSKNTHTALILDIQPIKKVDPLVAKLRVFADRKGWGEDESAMLANTIERLERGE